MKSKRPVTKSASADHQDDRSAKTPSRKTPAQVKAESAARKAKVPYKKIIYSNIFRFSVKSQTDQLMKGAGAFS